MNALETAKNFFDACEAPLGWEGCKRFVADGASFSAQSEPIADITSLQDYCNWMHGFGTVTAKGCSYTLHSCSWDEETRTALFFATFHGTHVGDGGPVPPTGKTTQSHYVYAITMDHDDKVSHMVKIWNAPWAMVELGWA